MVKEAELEKYCRKIEKVLVGNQTDKARILNTARCDMEEFLTEFPDATVDDLVKRFGTPEDYEDLKRSYDEQKAQLISNSNYGLADWEGNE